MVLEIPLVRQAYDQVLANEVRQAVRKLRALPLPRLDERRSGCGRSLREIAEGFIGRLRRIDGVAFGHPNPLYSAVPRPLGAILMDLETSFLGAQASLVALTPAQWSEVMSAPRGLSPWHQARRGELLWLALRDLIRHHRHLIQHIRSECLGEPIRRDQREAARTVLEPLGAA